MDAEFIVRQVASGGGSMLAVGATLLLAYRRRSGFAVKLAAQLPLVFIAVVTETWGLFLYCVPMTVVSVHGWLKWSNQ